MTKKTTHLRKITSIFMLFVTVFSLWALPVSASTAGKVNGSSYCTVNISDKLLNKRGKQYAKVTIKISDNMGWNNNAKIRVTLRDQYGNYITSWVTKGGTTIKLGDDHSIYRVYIERYNEPSSGNWFFNIFTVGDNFINTGKAVNWKITNPKDCSIQ